MIPLGLQTLRSGNAVMSGYIANRGMWRAAQAVVPAPTRALVPCLGGANGGYRCLASVERSPDVSIRSSKPWPLHPFWVLAKGKLTVWVAVSALPGYIVAAPVFSPLDISLLLLGTAACSASSQSMNQYLEREHDKKMKRTQQRPLVTGALSDQQALTFCYGTGAMGLGVLGSLNPLTATIGAATWAGYIYGYTPMKRLTPYNTHVGAIVGSLPTLLGFSAVCGGTDIISSPWLPHAVFVFTLQTLWQMPHFYSLAWLCRRDYNAAGYQMFCTDDATGAATARICFPYMAAIGVLPVAATALSLTSSMFLVDGLVVNALWLYTFRTFHSAPCTQTCRRFFLASMAHLLMTLGLFSLHAKTRDGNHPAWRKAAQAQVMKTLCIHEKFKDEPVFCPPTDAFSKK
eukprot:GEMP01042732.1.p1 GENE.GEMP01042732.1~~GEMP01042732.1.p1  ORF type:complete len:402 (+),score=64.82 GEMP01042732.1:238-1443(+)